MMLRIYDKRWTFSKRENLVITITKWLAIILMPILLPFGKSFQVCAQSIQSIQNNKNVSLVGRWTVGPCKTVAVSGNYAYIGYAGFLDILDISNP